MLVQWLDRFLPSESLVGCLSVVMLTTVEGLRGDQGRDNQPAPLAERDKR